MSVSCVRPYDAWSRDHARLLPGSLEEGTMKAMSFRPSSFKLCTRALPLHPWLATECKEAMMPKVVWGYAIAWDLVEVARELRVVADEISHNNAGVDTRRNMLSARADDQKLLLRAHLGR